MVSTAADGETTAPIRPKLRGEDWILRGCLLLLGVFLLAAILLPLYAMMSKSFQDGSGAFVGFANYLLYFKTPALVYSFVNSVQVAFISTVIVLAAGFVYAYALTRSCMPFKRFFRLVAFVPLLTPSLLGGIALVYWFGKQGVARGLLMGEPIYGPIGIVLGSCYWVFPHAIIILIAALSITDARLYEAAESLKAGRLRATHQIGNVGGGAAMRVPEVFSITDQPAVVHEFPRAIKGRQPVPRRQFDHPGAPVEKHRFVGQDQDRVGLRLQRPVERRRQVFRAGNVDPHRIELQRPGDRNELFPHARVDFASPLQEHGHRGLPGQDARENLHHLGQDVLGLAGQPGDIAAGPRQACNVAGTERVGVAHEHDGNGRGRVLCRTGVDRARRHDDIDLEPNQLGREIRKPLWVAIRRAVLDHDVPPLDVSELTQPLAERAEVRGVRRLVHDLQHPDTVHLPQLLGRDGKRGGENEHRRDNTESPRAPHAPQEDSTTQRQPQQEVTNHPHA